MGEGPSGGELLSSEQGQEAGGEEGPQEEQLFQAHCPSPPRPPFPNYAPPACR